MPYTCFPKCRFNLDLPWHVTNGFCRLSYLYKCSLSFSMLRMGIEITIENHLTELFTMLFECIIGKAEIISKMLLNLNSMVCCISFKHIFCLNVSTWHEWFNMMYILQASVFVYKYDCSFVVSCGGIVFELDKESCLHCFHLVDWHAWHCNNLAWS